MTSTELPFVRLKIERKSTHPWIFQKMVEKPEQKPRPGSIVDIVDATNHWVGRGFYNGHSRIALRVLTEDEQVVGPAVARIKAATDLPVAVGFGIRTPEAAEAIAKVADGPSLRPGSFAEVRVKTGEAAADEPVAAVSAPVVSGPSLPRRIEELEATVAQLQEELRLLRQEFVAFRSHFA